MSYAPIQRSILLTISGLTTRFYRGFAPPVAAVDGLPGVNYTDSPTLGEVKGWTEGITLTGGVGEYSPVEVSLVSAGTYADSSDPGRVFGRMGWQGADSWALLAVALDAAGTTVTLDRSMGLAAGDVVHLGRESVRVGAIGGGGTVLTGCTRGVGRTVAVPHRVRDGGGSRVTTPLVYFAGREAWIAISDGPGLPFVEVMAGRIAATPTVDGASVSFSISPWPCLLSGNVSQPLPEVGLAQGWHYFQAGRACVVEAAQVLPTQVVGYSTAYAAGVLTLDSSRNPGWAHESHFDPALVTGHPRRGSLMADGQTNTDQPTAYPASQQIAVPGNVPWAAGGGDGVTQAGVAELFRYDVTAGALADGLQPWPGALTSALATRLTSSHLGLAGAWLNVAVNPDASRLSLVRTAIFAANPSGADYDVRLLAARSAAIDWRQETGVNCEDWSTGEPSSSNRRALLWAPVDLRPKGSTATTVRYTVPLSQAPDVYEIGGVAAAWYQRGERYLLIESAPDGSAPVVMPAVGYAYVVLTGVEALPVSPAGQGGEAGEWLLEVSAVSAVATGATTSYLLTLTDRSVWARDGSGSLVGPWSVCDWPGQTRATVRQVPAGSGRRWLSLLEDILTSPAPGTRLPTGLALPPGAVDLGTDDGGLPPVRSLVAPDTDLANMANGWLRATSQALVLKRSLAGVSLELRAVGLEKPTALAEWLLTEDDCAAEEAPISTADDRVITVAELEVDWSLAGEPGRTVRVVDLAAQDVLGREETLTLELRGVILTDVSDATSLGLQLGARISAVAGYPRRLWRLSVPMAWASMVSLGDTVSVSHSLLRGYGPGMGVANATARVVELAYDPMGPMATVTLAHHGHNGSGWAPALRVVGIVSPVKVQVATAYYSTADLDWWAPGDGVRCVPVAGMDAALVTSVVGIVGDVVEVAAPHGLGIGDRLEPTTVPGVEMGGLAWLDDGSSIS